MVTGAQPKNISVSFQLISAAQVRVPRAFNGSRRVLPNRTFTPLPIVEVSPNNRLIVSLVPASEKKPMGMSIMCVKVSSRNLAVAICTTFSAK